MTMLKSSHQRRVRQFLEAFTLGELPDRPTALSDEETRVAVELIENAAKDLAAAIRGRDVAAIAEMCCVAIYSVTTVLSRMGISDVSIQNAVDQRALGTVGMAGFQMRDGRWQAPAPGWRALTVVEELELQGWSQSRPTLAEGEAALDALPIVRGKKGGAPC